MTRDMLRTNIHELQNRDTVKYTFMPVSNVLSNYCLRCRRPTTNFIHPNINLAIDCTNGALQIDVTQSRSC